MDRSFAAECCATKCVWQPFPPSGSRVPSVPMIITIDGPAGSGKSTVARKLAAHLEIPYLDTGAMYRALAYAALRGGVGFSDESALYEFAKDVQLEVDCGPTFSRVRINGHDVSEAIRSMEVSDVLSPVAKHEGIRKLLVEHQRRIGQELGSVVTEGRDQGSVVFPRADHKFILLADLPQRAERRHRDMVADGEDVDIKAVTDNLVRRDAVDSKQWEPLLASGNAVAIDTTRLTIHQVLERILAELADSGPR